MGSPFDEQPGLEAIPYNAGLEHTPLTADPRLTQWKDAQASTVVQDIEKEAVLSPDKTPGILRKRRLWIFIAVLAILVILGAVVGGVVGSRNAHNNNNNSPVPAAEDNSNSTLLRQKSALAATGWRMEGRSNIQLFYQGKDNFVYYSGWDSGHRSWSTPTKLAIGAAADTPMAASLIFQQSVQDVSRWCHAYLRQYLL